MHENSRLICSESHVKYIHSYCEECRVYLCYQCKPLHSGHTLQDITTLKKSYITDCENLLSKVNTFIENQNESLGTIATEIADLITVQVTRTYQKLMREIEQDMHKRLLKLLGTKTVHGFVAHKTQQQKLQIDKLCKMRDELKEMILRVNHPENTIVNLINAVNSENVLRLSDEIMNSQAILDFTVKNRQAQIRSVKLETKYDQSYVDKMLKINDPLLRSLENVIEEELAARKNKLIHLKLSNEFCLIDPYSHKIVTRPLKADNKFPFSFDYIEVENRVFISGGETTPGKVLKDTHELEEQQGILLRKARMKVEKKWHTLCEFSKTSFYSIGGCNTLGPLAICEKYDIEKNEWTLKPMLNEAKYYCGAAGINSRYVYAFAGYDDASDLKTIEVLDEQDIESGWKVVELANEAVIWSGRRNIGCYPISDKEIVVFGGWDGNWRNETFVFHTMNKTLYYASPLLRGEKFYRSKPKKIEGIMYIIGYHYTDLHSYSLINKTWSMKAQEQWAPKL